MTFQSKKVYKHPKPLIIILLFGIAFNYLIGLPTAKAEENVKDVIPKSWLLERTTTEQAEKQNLVSDERLGPDPVPFGFMNKEWTEFKSKLLPGDEIWKFRSSEKSWENLAGREGFCIVRDSIIVEALVTLMN